MVHLVHEQVYAQFIDKKSTYILAGDIGGTNSNFGIIDLENGRPQLLIYFQAHSQEIADYPIFFKELTEYIRNKYDISCSRACIGAAGVVFENRIVKLTNLPVTLDAQQLQKSTGIKNLILINDFEAVGAGIDYCNQKDIVTIHAGKGQPKAHKACLGAGTGLGKSLLIWNEHAGCYIPHASEGGHADYAAYTQEECALGEFIKKEKNDKHPISWEDVISGRGIQRIYRFLATQKKYPETEITRLIHKQSFAPDNISRYALQDEQCRDTFVWYIRLYARCTKNYAFDALALNGIYIAGGIAARNVELFKNSLFLQEFMNCDQLCEIIQDIPVYVVADYTINLYGAARWMYLSEQKIVG